MNIDYKPNSGETFPAFYLFFIIVMTQIGVGILNIPHEIFNYARQDSWISVIIAFLGLIIVLTIMFIILSRYNSADILGIQQDLFGNIVGKVLGSCYLFYFFVNLISVLTTYIDIVKVFISATFTTTGMAFLLLFLVCYSVLGGIRVIVGTSFLLFFTSFWLILLFYEPMSKVDITNYFPIFDASITDILKGARMTSYTLFGPELLFFLYPFIENKKKAKLPVFLGVTYTSSIILFLTLTSIGYYSLNQLELMTFPALNLFKSVSFSFIERLDYLILATWMVLTISTCIFLMWSIVHGMERMFRIPQKKTLFIVAVLALILAGFLSDALHAQKLAKIQSQVGFFIVFIYPIILLPFVLIKKRRKKQKDVPQNEHC